MGTPDGPAPGVSRSASNQRLSVQCAQRKSRLDRRAAVLMREFLADPGRTASEDELFALQSAEGLYLPRLMSESADYRAAVRELFKRTHPGADVHSIQPASHGPSEAELDAMYSHLSPDSVVRMLRDPDAQ